MAIDIMKNIRLGYTVKELFTTPLNTKVPRINIRDGINWNILTKLVLLHNNLIQYFDEDYDEVILFNIDNPTGVVLYQLESMFFSTPQYISQIKKILERYMTSGIIKKSDMLIANDIWDELLNIRDAQDIAKANMPNSAGMDKHQ